MHNVVDLLPLFVGAPGVNNSAEWKGACFYKNEAWMDFTTSNDSELGSGVLHIEVFTIAYFHSIIFFLRLFEKKP
jgi:hypothetical protein